MIVKCASCQTRFKIGDEKVTDRGVKVRCTKCGTIFRVRKDPPAEAALSSAATPLEDLVAPPPTSPPPSANGGPASSGGSDALEDIFQSMVPDPTGAGQDRPYQPPPTNPGPGLDLPPPAVASPPAPPPDAGAEANDPFTLLGSSLPVEAPPMVGRRATNGKSPLETLASLDDPFDLPLDLLGKNKTPMPPPSSSEPLEDDPFAAFAAAAASASQSGPSPFAQSNGASPDFADPLAGLDLDPGRAGIPASPPEQDGSSRSDTSPWGESLDLDTAATEPKARGPIRPPTPAGAPVAFLPAETTKVTDSPRPPTNAGRDAGRGQDRAPARDQRSKDEVPLHTRVVNALASVSTVLLALLIFVIARSGGKLDLRDPGTAFLAAFGVHRPVPVSQSLPAIISGSGLYRSESGLPVLFVRGRVQNLTQRSQRVRVRLTVEDSGRVAAESEAWPAIVPTPDELYSVRSSADVRQLQRGWDEHEPPPLDAHGTADFMVVTAELPTSLSSLLLKVTAVPLGEGANRTGADAAAPVVTPPTAAAP
jgi:predicted Zn finger-like uncharacterized protein